MILKFPKIIILRKKFEFNIFSSELNKFYENISASSIINIIIITISTVDYFHDNLVCTTLSNLIAMLRVVISILLCTLLLVSTHCLEIYIIPPCVQHSLLPNVIVIVTILLRWIRTWRTKVSCIIV